MIRRSKRKRQRKISSYWRKFFNVQSIRCLTTAERTGAQLWKSQGLLHLQVNHTKHWAIRDQGELYIRTELDKMTFPWPTSSQTSTISACNSLFWSCLPFCPRQGQLPSISSWTWNSRPFIQIAFGGNKDTYLNIHLSCSYAGHSIHHCEAGTRCDSDALSVCHNPGAVQGMFCYQVKGSSTPAINN